MLDVGAGSQTQASASATRALNCGATSKFQLKERIGTADNKGLGLKIRSLVSVSPTEFCFKRLDLAETCGQRPGSQGVSLMLVVCSLASNLQANDNGLVTVPETDVGTTIIP